MKRSIAAAVATAIGLILLAAPSAHAQGTITAIGKVVDAQGNPVPDVQVLLDYKGHIVQKYRTKTDKKGVFTHVNVYSGTVPDHPEEGRRGRGLVQREPAGGRLAAEAARVQVRAEGRGGRAAAARVRPRSRRRTRGGSRRHGPAHERDQQRDRALEERRHRRGDRRVRGDPREDAGDPARAPQPRDALQEEGRRGPGAGRAAEVRRARPRASSTATSGLATLLAETGKRAEAIAAVKKGTAENPQSGRLQYALGVLAEGSGDAALAKEAFLKAEQLDPQNFETQYHLATVALNQNDKAEAVARLEKFIAAAPAGTPEPRRREVAARGAPEEVASAGDGREEDAVSAENVVWLAVAVLLAAPALTAPPQAPPPTAATPVFGSGTQAVVLDVVARDKKGRTVRRPPPRGGRGARGGPAEGDPVASGSSTRTAAAPSTAGPARAAAARLAPPRAEADRATRRSSRSLFDSLDAEGRLFARRAALELRRDRGPARPRASPSSSSATGCGCCSSSRPTARPWPPPSSAPAACSTRRGVVPGAAAMEQAADTASRANDKAQAAGDAAIGGGGAAAGAAAGQAAADAGFANVELRAVEMAENVERSQRGNARSSASSRSRASSSGSPGRKAIVYFSEGLQVPNQLQPLYRSVVSEANRANLSVYSVDARGLRTTSDFDRTRTDLTKSRENVRRQVQSRGGRAVTREDVLAGEVAEDAITMNAQGMLGALSESTGGRLIANSNDVRAGLDRAIDDTSGYYEVTYDPQLAAFDGCVPAHRVKVKRPGVERPGRARATSRCRRARAPSTSRGSCRC